MFSGVFVFEGVVCEDSTFYFINTLLTLINSINFVVSYKYATFANRNKEGNLFQKQE